MLVWFVAEVVFAWFFTWFYVIFNVSQQWVLILIVFTLVWRNWCLQNFLLGTLRLGRVVKKHWIPHHDFLTCQGLSLGVHRGSNPKYYFSKNIVSKGVVVVILDHSFNLVLCQHFAIKNNFFMSFFGCFTLIKLNGWLEQVIKQRLINQRVHFLFRWQKQA